MEQRSLRTGVSGREWGRVGGIRLIPRYLLAKVPFTNLGEGMGWNRLGEDGE